jgi:UDP-glucose 4-epimerase
MAMYLVTGGAGFIGSHIVEALVRRGERVRVLDNLSTGRRENLASVIGSVELVVGDVRCLDQVRRVMSGVDYVLHQAALVSVPQSMADPQGTHDVNVTGTLNVLIAAREATARRVVLASSCSVYGDNDSLPLKETCAPRPLSPYAASKLIGEICCQTFFAAYGLPAVCLRYFNVYGARQNPNGDYASVVPKFVGRMKMGQPPVIYGDGEQTRDFVCVADVVRANLAACEGPRAVGRVINVVSGHSISLLHLVATLNVVLGTQLAPEFKPERKGDIRHSAGDGGQMAELLGLGVTTSLAEGLGQLAA